MDDNKTIMIILCSFLAAITVIFITVICWSYYNEACFIENGYSQENTQSGIIWVKK